MISAAFSGLELIAGGSLMVIAAFAGGFVAGRYAEATAMLEWMDDERNAPPVNPDISAIDLLDAPPAPRPPSQTRRVACRTCGITIEQGTSPIRFALCGECAHRQRL